MMLRVKDSGKPFTVKTVFDSSVAIEEISRLVRQRFGRKNIEYYGKSDGERHLMYIKLIDKSDYKKCRQFGAAQYLSDVCKCLEHLISWDD